MNVRDLSEYNDIRLKKLKDGVEYLRSVILLTQKSENLSSFEVARLDGMRVALSMVTGEEYEDIN